jgi:hypothetical protein
MTDKYGAFFDNFQGIIDGFVELVKKFYNTIKGFVDGFKKNITVDEEFSDMDD